MTEATVGSEQARHVLDVCVCRGASRRKGHSLGQQQGVKTPWQYGEGPPDTGIPAGIQLGYGASLIKKVIPHSVGKGILLADVISQTGAGRKGE